MNHDNQWVISSIHVYDPKYHTARGIHVGSKYSELQKEYPAMKIFEEEGGRVAVDKPSGISFSLSTDGPLSSATVQSLLLTGTH
jgi:hypothetical protein